jgi:glyoxalase family protein
MTPRTLGIHHVTAIAADPQRNLDFYAGVLGLRLVKRTVNFDDPSTYHFYFGDDLGRPGSILTFFPWRGARRGHTGAGQASIISFPILPSSMDYWLERLAANRVAVAVPSRRFGAEVLGFSDRDGLSLELVATPDAGLRQGWAGGGVPPEHAIRGLHSVTLRERRLDPTARLLVDLLGFRSLGQENGRHRFAAGDGGPGTLVDIELPPQSDSGLGGAGTVHHVAWRAADDTAQLELRERLAAKGHGPTPVIDRNYFHSIYFREPGGVLFEIATDPPGFTIDESADRLGERLMLPARYEDDRVALEGLLPPVTIPALAAGSAR